MKKHNQQQKTLLAKLLATEDITVIFQKAQTASFNMTTRVLTIPILKDEYSANLLDMFIAHEVSHALNTPDLKNYKDLFDENPGIHKYLNIIEDIRVDRLIQKKYPGFKRQYHIAYQEMKTLGMFGDIDKEIENNQDDMLNIDKIYILTRAKDVANTAAVVITDVIEKSLIDIDNMISFNDCIAIAKFIYDSDKKKLEEQNQDESEKQNGDSDSEDSQEDSQENQDSNNNSEDSQEDSQENIDGDNNSKSDSQDDSQEDSQENNQQQEKSAGNDVNSIEDKELLSEKINKQLDDIIDNDSQTPERLYADYLEPVKIENAIVDYKHFYEIISKKDIHNAIVEVGSKAYATFIKKSMPFVNNLVKEFEMKKAASDYAKSYTSKTGTLNTNKLHQYKCSDNIFKSNTIHYESKNHGMIIYLDWSGSMDYGITLRKSIEQLLMFVKFAQKVNIPFEVYVFTNNLGPYDKGDKFTQKSTASNLKTKAYFNNNLTSYDTKKIWKILSSDMNSKVLTDMMMAIYTIFAIRRHNKVMNTIKDYNESNIFGDLCRQYGLRGTPLCEALYILPTVIKNFQSKHSIEKPFFILITDGEASDNIKFSDYSNLKSGSNYDVYIKDTISNNELLAYSNYKDVNNQAFFIDFLKLRCPDVKTLAFYISSDYMNLSGCRYIANNYATRKENQKELKDKKYKIFDTDKLTVNFDKLYLVYFDKSNNDNVEVNNMDISDYDNVDDAVLNTSLDYIKEIQQQKKSTNIIFKSVIEMIA